MRCEPTQGKPPFARQSTEGFLICRAGQSGLNTDLVTESVSGYAFRGASAVQACSFIERDIFWYSFPILATFWTEFLFLFFNLPKRRMNECASFIILELTFKCGCRS